MEFDFLKPISEDILNFIETLSFQSLGKNVSFHTSTEFPNLTEVKVVILGVLENRGLDADIKINLIHFRKEFYSLFLGNWEHKMGDLGDILMGHSIADTYYALEKVIERLLKLKIIPIVIGGSQDLTYPVYRAYDRLEQMVNLVAIDNKFDFGQEGSTLANSYLTKMIVDKPNNLFNYSNIGYQTHNNSQEEIDLIEDLFFEAYRLGKISSNINISEPILRDADIVSIDLRSIKSSESGNFFIFVPNGFSGEEICVLSRYAGISDKVSVFGIFNHNDSKAESVLMAQIIWYFIEGIHHRSYDYPFRNKESYIKYIVPLHEDLVFYKSDKTDRWWVEVIFSTGDNKLKRTTLLSCSHEDYLAACSDIIPERWRKVQRKNIF